MFCDVTKWRLEIIWKTDDLTRWTTQSVVNVINDKVCFHLIKANVKRTLEVDEPSTGFSASKLAQHDEWLHQKPCGCKAMFTH